MKDEAYSAASSFVPVIYALICTLTLRDKQVDRQWLRSTYATLVT